jgi:uncharacterized protein (TIGR03437 family)
MSKTSSISLRAAGVAIGFLSLGATAPAQQNVLGTNLIVNGNAEAGPAGTSFINLASSIPGWTATGKPNVLSYGLTGAIQTNSPAPMDRQFQYFVAGPSVSTLQQKIDVSSAASAIAAGTIEYSISAFLGSASAAGYVSNAQMAVAFENAGGQTFTTVKLGPLGFNNGLNLQQQIGLVPAGTAQIVVTLTLNYGCLNAVTCGYGAADSLSLVLNQIPTNPQTILGSNLVVNPGAEVGPGVANPGYAPYIPGWSTSGGASVSPYNGYQGFITDADPGPSDRGVNLFYGGPTAATSDIYQNVDVSAAASVIDKGGVQFEMSAWLGGLAGHLSPTLTYTFYDWTGKQLAATGQLGPIGVAHTSLVSQSQTGVLPVGTRWVNISLSFHFGINGADTGGSLADNISFIIGAPGAPIITSESTVPVYSTATTIESGSWVSIYGTGLASGQAVWKGDFPTTLGNTTVTIDSKPAYLWFVSPTQINLQVPDDASTGTVSVVVTTPAGSATSMVTLSQYAPSFSLFDSKHAAAIVVTSGPGNSGSGYDYIGPTTGLPFVARPVKAGETVVLYGVGFGATNPPVPAGAPLATPAPSVVLPTITIGGVNAPVTYGGMVQSGLFQFNVVVPNAGSGDKPLLATIGGVTTPASVVLTLQ